MTLEFLSDVIASGAKSHRVSSTPEMKKGQWYTLFECDGPGMITHLWFTFPTHDRMIGRRNLIRMYWDNEKNPSVEAPLSDFFGIPFGYTGIGFKMASQFITIAPRNGCNSYFPMPFARHARIEILPDEIESGPGFYFQADYYTFPRELPAKYRDLRFHAQFRFENPAENYGRNYLMLDATGKGALVGVTLGVETNEPQADSWYHGGGDSIWIDGEGSPSALHGIGAEDFFGHSWGVEEYNSPYIGTPLQERDVYGTIKKVASYRFFGADPVPFDKSIRCILGALANSYSSVAYWYQDEPHRPFFRVPKADKRMPGSVAPYGTYDVEPKNAPEWKLLAPFKLTASEPFKKVRSLEKRETGKESFVYEAAGELPTLPDGNKLNVKWTPQTAHHNWVDFHYVARPATKYIKLQTSVVGYALRYVTSDRDKEVNVAVGFDDEISVRVNGREAYHGTHEKGFEQDFFTVRLKKGRNRILVKLSNFANTTWRLWAFTFRMGN